MAPETVHRVDVKEIRDLLLERSRILQFELAGLEFETLGGDSERVGAHSAAPRHPAELASETSEKELLYSRLESQAGELREVRDALERLEDGFFGQCDDCDEAIPLDRLRAIPYARLCMRCKSAEEQA